MSSEPFPKFSSFIKPKVPSDHSSQIDSHLKPYSAQDKHKSIEHETTSTQDLQSDYLTKDSYTKSHRHKSNHKNREHKRSKRKKHKQHSDDDLLTSSSSSDESRKSSKKRIPIVRDDIYKSGVKRRKIEQNEHFSIFRFQDRHSSIDGIHIKDRPEYHKASYHVLGIPSDIKVEYSYDHSKFEFSTKKSKFFDPAKTSHRYYSRIKKSKNSSKQLFASPSIHSQSISISMDIDNDDVTSVLSLQQQRELELNKKSSSLYEIVKLNPHDIDAWINLVTFQTEYKDIIQSNSDRLSAAYSKPKSMLETQLSITKKALDSNPGNIRLILLEMEIQISLLNGQECYDLWAEKVSEFPDSPELWMAFISFVATNFNFFTISRLRKIIVSAVSHLNSAKKRLIISQEETSQFTENFDERANKISEIETAICDILLKYIYMEFYTGHSERAIGLFQALIEIQLFIPSTIIYQMNCNPKTAKETLLYSFQLFWDSELPRIGEKNAKGWSHAFENFPHIRTSINTYNPLSDVVDTDIGQNLNNGHLSQTDDDKNASFTQRSENLKSFFSYKNSGISSADQPLLSDSISEFANNEWMNSFRLPIRASESLNSHSNINTSRVVLFEDLSDYVVYFGDPKLAYKILTSFLELLGIMFPIEYSTSSASFRSNEIFGFYDTRPDVGILPEFFEFISKTYSSSVRENVWTSQQLSMDICNLPYIPILSDGLHVSLKNQFFRSNLQYQFTITLLSTLIESSTKITRKIQEKLEFLQNLINPTLNIDLNGKLWGSIFEIEKEYFGSFWDPNSLNSNVLITDRVQKHLNNINSTLNLMKVREYPTQCCRLVRSVSDILMSLNQSDIINSTLLKLFPEIDASSDDQILYNNFSSRLSAFVEFIDGYLQNLPQFSNIQIGFENQVTLESYIQAYIDIVSCMIYLVDPEDTLEYFVESVSLQLLSWSSHVNSSKLGISEYIEGIHEFFLVQHIKFLYCRFIFNHPGSGANSLLPKISLLLRKYPSNKLLLSMYITVSEKFKFLFKSRLFFDKLMVDNASIVSITTCLFICRSETEKSSYVRVKRILDTLLHFSNNSFSHKTQSILLWECYINLELSHGHWKLAKDILNRLIQSCPWAKSLWLYSLNQLKNNIEKNEFNEVLAIMREKEIT